MRSRPVWDDALGDEELRVLDPGPADLDTTPDVLVVGGGAVGLAAAVMCRRAGLGRVQVIERDRCGAGPSGSAAGGISPVMHAVAHPAFVAMAYAGLVVHRELATEWDGATGFRSLDWLIVSSERIASGDSAVPGMQPVDADRAHEIEPQLGDLAGAIHVRDQGWVHPVRFAVALAQRAGAVATQVTMTGMVRGGDRITRVDTTAGLISPGAVVFATGTCPPEVADVPRMIVKGHLLATAPLPVRVRTALASLVIVLPLDDGGLLAGGTFHPEDDSPEVRDHVIADVREELVRLVPAAADVPVAFAWCCFRPGTPDEMPVIDRVPGLANAWLSIGHYRTGLMMAPACGEALAGWIGSGERPSSLEAFALARFPSRV